MPDENKLQALRDAEFTVRATCETCEHWKPPTTRTRWGYCTWHTYEHGKHSGGPRPTGTPRNGHCPSYRLSPSATEELDGTGYSEFQEAAPC